MAAVTTGSIITGLQRYRQDALAGLDAVLTWWMAYMPDPRGGFWGSMNNNNEPDAAAQKGIVLNSRILWTFSAAHLFTRDPAYLQMAKRAYNYITQYFVDAKYGGLYWSVNAEGKMLEGRKQIYGQAFGIYGLAEYYKASGNTNALEQAIQLYRLIEQHSYDTNKGGYIEAFTQSWQPLADMRLSEKDDNVHKTMNTHLHIVEAYANLYRVWPDAELREKIAGLLHLFDQYIIHHGHHHLKLFMDGDWQLRSSLISYGHDIEAAWLLLECAEAIESPQYINLYRYWAVQLANAAAEGLDTDGGLWYEYEPATNHWVYEKHSWPQAEAMVGFLNAYQLTGQEEHLHRSAAAFTFVQQQLQDPVHGEWFWGRANGRVMDKEKAGFWKCPYHNSRAFMEVARRIDLLQTPTYHV